MATITKGTINRATNAIDKQIDNIQKAQEKLTITQIQQTKHKVLKAYEKVVTETYLKIFNKNYGTDFDYNTLMSSFNFNVKVVTGKNNTMDFIPESSCDISKIKFIGDFKSAHQKFNENSIDDFITNEDSVKGDYMDNFSFDNSSDYDNYQNSDLDYEELDLLDGQFIPTVSNKDRYGEFNRINKLMGYEPKEKAAQDATREAHNIWNKNKNKVITSVIK